MTEAQQSEFRSWLTHHMGHERLEKLTHLGLLWQLCLSFEAGYVIIVRRDPNNPEHVSVTALPHG